MKKYFVEVFSTNNEYWRAKLEGKATIDEEDQEDEPEAEQGEEEGEQGNEECEDSVEEKEEVVDGMEIDTTQENEQDILEENIEVEEEYEDDDLTSDNTLYESQPEPTEEEFQEMRKKMFGK